MFILFIYVHITEMFQRKLLDRKYINLYSFQTKVSQIFQFSFNQTEDITTVQIKAKIFLHKHFVQRKKQ